MNMNISILGVLTVWFLIGIVGAIVMTIYELRETEYHEAYFDADLLVSAIGVVIAGPATIIIMICIIVNNIVHKHNLLSKISYVLYEIANVGTNKKEVR